MVNNSVIRLAVVEDILDLIDGTREGNAESGYGLAYNKDNAFKYLYDYIADDDCDVLVAERDGAVIGFAMLGQSFEFHDKSFCYIGKFWVFLAGRRTDAGRKLLESALAWAKEKDCSYVFVTATAELHKKEQTLFINLMKKYGLAERGPVLSLKME